MFNTFSYFSVLNGVSNTFCNDIKNGKFYGNRCEESKGITLSVEKGLR